MLQPLVALDDIHLRYNERQVLRGVSCAIYRGRHLAILGENGSGKSSLLRILSGELWPTRERGSRWYLLQGETPTASPLLAKPYIRRVAPEMQERFLRLELRFTVFEFVASGLADRDYAEVALRNEERVQVDAVLDMLRLRHVADKEARQLSHGTLRRAFVARALVAEPRLLLLDEVTDGLDTASRELVLALLDRAIDAGTTLVCAVHQVERLPACVRDFYELRDGLLRTIERPEPGQRDSAAVEHVGRFGQQHKLRPIVELTHVHVAIDETPVLFDIDFCLNAGEHIAITGANGAGKSTLAGVIDGTYLPSSGLVVRSGYERRPPLAEIRRRVVTLSDALQIRHDWYCSVRETIAAGFSGTIGINEDLDQMQQRRIDELLERFALHGFADRLIPHLSFGQRRRVLLARALVREPEVLILDEIFDGLDHATRAMLDVALAEAAAGGTTLICIAHVESEIPSYITRRIMLAAGRIIAIKD